MEITTENGRFYVDNTRLVALATEKGVHPTGLSYAQIASIAMPYDLWLLMSDKARLEAIPRVTDEYLLEWSRTNCPEIAIQEANDRQLIDITNQINSWQP